MAGDMAGAPLCACWLGMAGDISKDTGEGGEGGADGAPLACRYTNMHDIGHV
jgi:hypothetical protein